MPLLVKRLLLVAGGLIGLVVVVFAAAFLLLPRDTIQREAQRAASRASDATITWTRLTPGFSDWSIGVRVHGLAVRMPKEGPTRVNARLDDVFVRFKLFPLFLRRVEIAAARIKGGGIAMTDRGPDSTREGSKDKRPSDVSMVVPRVDIEDVDIRSRDALGGGVDLRRVHGYAEIEGTLESPKAVRLAVVADSLFWKGSPRDSLVALPSPLDVDVALVGKDQGKQKRLEVTKGIVLFGPLTSKVTGEVRIPGDPDEPSLALSIVGEPQPIRSSDASIRPLLGRSPAVWNATVSWEVKVEGPLSAQTQTGRVFLNPLAMNAPSNTFTLEQASASWTTRADRTFGFRGEGSGGGINFTADARGTMTPGGSINGEFTVRAPAERLNGLLPDTPTWTGGTIEAEGTFTILPPPALPIVKWTVIGKGMQGTVPGVARPVRKLDFNVQGDAAAISVKSADAVVGSTTASVTGRIAAGKPLGTGTFQVAMDRLVAEEWVQPKAATSARTAARGGAPPPPPFPFRTMDATVRVGQVRSGSMIVRDLAIPVRYAAGRLTAEPIRGAIGTGTLEGGLALSDFGLPAQRFNLHMDVKRAPVEEMANGLLPIRLGLTGLVSGLVDLSGPGMPGPEVGDSLRGAMSGSVENGAFKQGPGLKKIREALGLSPSTEMAFKTLTHKFRIEGGRLLLDKMSGDIGKDLLEMSGSLGFDQSLNMDLLLRLAPERIKSGTAVGEFARFARDADGRIPIQMKLTGTTLQPKISMKASGTIASAGKALTQELVKGLATKVTTKATATADSAAAKPDSADSTKRAAIQKGRDALKRLLGK